MARDFREMLEEVSRDDEYGRYFKEIAIGFKLVMSIQASNMHGCEPAETLDDVYAYKSFDVSVRQFSKPIDAPKIGAWSELRAKEWAEGFDRPEYRRDMAKECVPTEVVQTIFEDIIDYAREKGHLEADQEPSLVDPEEPIRKMRKGCGGSCAAKK
ncbi:hypothetical protein [Pseudodesulfovibrio senegalensis]|jgi:hypothetical protein|uniref:Uncharacterized protein n=1 Tax=Pseudodesulfovibrio senegalensis TaxID=1721087 RepID=A0A6N6MYT3_9BACT|nr:hypothetical protein [Pseudodesulfovibrio senegalensis]KAB1437207.1 hypothetical protein F8A88_15610 [Pseudodesulfovibrio senegalensis]